MACPLVIRHAPVRCGRAGRASERLALSSRQRAASIGDTDPRNLDRLSIGQEDPGSRGREPGAISPAIVVVAKPWAASSASAAPSGVSAPR